MTVFDGVVAHDAALGLAADPAAAAGMTLRRQAAHHDVVIAAKRQSLRQCLGVAKVQPAIANQRLVTEQCYRARRPDAWRSLQRGNQIGRLFHGRRGAGQQAGGEIFLA